MSYAMAKVGKTAEIFGFLCFAYFRRIFPSISLGSIIFTSRRADSVRYVCARARIAAAVCGYVDILNFACRTLAIYVS